MLAERNWIGWFYRLGERQVGPVPRSKIAALVTGGQMRRGEPVWKAWNEGDEYRLVRTKAEEALVSALLFPPGAPCARLWTVFAANQMECEN